MTGLTLTASGISHCYGDLLVLDDVSVAIPAGEVTVLLGPSGCGKSTLLGILGGMIAPAEGHVTMEGEAPPDCLNALTYVFQDFSLLPWRSVAGNVSLVLEERLARPERERRVAEVLALTGLSDFAGAWPRELSGGMRQRVGIARALAVRPACLLLDEPFSALDAQTRDLLIDDFVRVLGGLGTTVVHVTHNLAEAVRLAHHIFVLSRRPGKIRAKFSLPRPLAERRADDADLIALEKQLWALIRDDAADAMAEREMAGRRAH